MICTLQVCRYCYGYLCLYVSVLTYLSVCLSVMLRACKTKLYATEWFLLNCCCCLLQRREILLSLLFSSTKWRVAIVVLFRSIQQRRIAEYNLHREPLMAESNHMHLWYSFIRSTPCYPMLNCKGHLITPVFNTPLPKVNTGKAPTSNMCKLDHCLQWNTRA